MRHHVSVLAAAIFVAALVPAAANAAGPPGTEQGNFVHEWVPNMADPSGQTFVLIACTPRTLDPEAVGQGFGQGQCFGTHVHPVNGGTSGAVPNESSGFGNSGIPDVHIKHGPEHARWTVATCAVVPDHPEYDLCPWLGG